MVTMSTWCMLAFGCKYSYSFWSWDINVTRDRGHFSIDFILRDSFQMNPQHTVKLWGVSGKNLCSYPVILEPEHVSAGHRNVWSEEVCVHATYSTKEQQVSLYSHEASVKRCRTSNSELMNWCDEVQRELWANDIKLHHIQTVTWENRCCLGLGRSTTFSRNSTTKWAVNIINPSKTDTPCHVGLVLLLFFFFEQIIKSL